MNEFLILYNSITQIGESFFVASNINIALFYDANLFINTIHSFKSIELKFKYGSSFS